MTTDVHIGSHLGAYTIEELVGRGGMGIVYRAQHDRLGRRVALKLLAPELAENASFRERFVRESRLAAAIDHPNVIPIYEAGEDAGVYFIAMRYVEGVDLRQVLDTQGAQPLERALSILGQVAGGLDAAHEQGLVHRDVKPGNVLLVAGSDHCYLTDFGLTKAVASDTNFTATGHFVGTTDYVAPEQIEGKELDRRTDVYSLGCVFYECLTGLPPFRRDSDMAVMWAHIQEPPPTVSDKRGDVPAELDRVIATAMAKSKDHRYPSCSQFAAAARSALEVGTGRSFVAPTAPGGVALPPYVAPLEEIMAATPPANAPPAYWQQPPAQVPPAPPPRQRSLTPIAVIVAALLLAGGGTAAALIITHNKHGHVTTTNVSAPASPQGTSTDNGGTITPTTPQITQPVGTPTKPGGTPGTGGGGGGGSGTGAEQAVRDYWNALRSRDYRGAYALLDPSQAPPESTWIHARKGDGLYSVNFNGGVSATGVTSTGATVTVTDLVTQQTSCQTQHWSGSYTMVRQSGQWLISAHQLNKPPC